MIMNIKVIERYFLEFGSKANLPTIVIILKQKNNRKTLKPF